MSTKTTSPIPAEELVRLEVEDGVAYLIFDRPGSGANIFDEATLDALDQRLDWAASRTDLRGLVLETAKDSIFVAGADLSLLSKSTAEDLKEFLWKGQQVFNRLDDLGIPTVAAIHGAAMGGGLEVALACDWRIASDERATRMALPETQLGILPAWGGSTRLPRLLGVPASLAMILKGSSMNPRQAYKAGLIDGTCPRSRLRVLAEQMIEKGRRRLNPKLLGLDPLSASIIRRKALEGVAAKTHGHYPAQEAAVEIVTRALGSSRSESLGRERDAVARLAGTGAAKNLMRVFFLSESSKKLGREVKLPPIKSVAVVGAGVMGAGIAHWLSSRGLSVLLLDISPEAIARGLATCEKLRAAMVRRRLIDGTEADRMRDRISATHERVPLHRMDLVIEAAVEDLEIKKKIFRDLSNRASSTTILATNTSALPITDLAADPGISHPERVIGLHFFNPVHLMKLVEVVAAPRSSVETVASMTGFVQRIGKLPVLVRDSPGFVVNRILMPYLVEAGHLFDRGVDPLEIDQAMLDFGMPMGPLRLLDEVGLDVGRHVAATMEREFPGRFAVPPVLDRLVEEGQLGVKSGGGFFIHEKGSKEAPTPSPAALAARGMNEPVSLSREAIADRLVLLMVNESFKCLEEKVADTEDDIDFAMIMGAGFAPFRGGPITHAKASGYGHCLEILRALHEEEGPRYEPSELLVRYAEGRRRQDDS